MRHFAHRLPTALDHEGFSSVANPIEQLGKLRAASVAEMTRLPLTEWAAWARGFGFGCFRPRNFPFLPAFIII
jgi:hypothetical protein